MSTADESGARPIGSGRTAARRGERLRQVSVDFEIPFHDVDALQIVWHGHYYKYFELARTALMRSCQLDGPEVFEIGHGLLVIESQCRHIAPLAYGDRARVSAWFSDIVHRLHIRYEIENLSQNRRAARGHTTLVATTRKGEMLHRTPDLVLKRIQ